MVVRKANKPSPNLATAAAAAAAAAAALRSVVDAAFGIQSLPTSGAAGRFRIQSLPKYELL